MVPIVLGAVVELASPGNFEPMVVARAVYTVDGIIAYDGWEQREKPEHALKLGFHSTGPRSGEPFPVRHHLARTNIPDETLLGYSLRSFDNCVSHDRLHLSSSAICASGGGGKCFDHPALRTLSDFLSLGVGRESYTFRIQSLAKRIAWIQPQSF